MRHSIIYRSILVLFTILISIEMSVGAYAKYYHDNIHNIFVHGKTHEKIIALTFDDGPHPTKTKKILDVLDKYNVKATFFVIGENATKYPDILREVNSRGHEIGNHTYDHKSIYKLDTDGVAEEIEKCTRAIETVIGSRPTLFRPPEGFMNDDLARVVDSCGYNVVLWKVDTYDWKGRGVDEISEDVLKNVNCGDIILMHDYIWRDSHTDQALDKMIPQLILLGYRFCTVSELIS